MAPFLILSLSSLWSPLACIPAQPPQAWALSHQKDPFPLAIFPQRGNCIADLILSVPKHLPRLPRALRSPHVASEDLSNGTRLPHHPQPLLGTAQRTPCGSPPPRKLLHTLQGPDPRPRLPVSSPGKGQHSCPWVPLNPMLPKVFKQRSCFLMFGQSPVCCVQPGDL